jgi:hypothetical protein
VSQLQSLQLKQKSGVVHTLAGSCYGTGTDMGTAEPDLELHVMEPSDITLQAHGIPDPLEYSPSQNGSSTAQQVRFLKPLQPEGLQYVIG